MDCSIRRATSEDYDAVAVAFAELELFHQSALPGIFRRPIGPALSRELFESMLADVDAAWLVAQRPGEIIGFVSVRVVQAADRPILVPRSYAEVDSLAVREPYRRFGIGRALMAHAQRWATERGLREIELNVWEFNQSAIAFYEALGYVTERRKMRRIISDVNS
jgi:ribosomal protein S18 acetylase RimI-like enzyme